MEIGGDQSKGGVSTATNDISGNTSRARFSRGHHGKRRQVFCVVSGKATSKDGVPTEVKGNWGFTGGSGKLKGIKGKDTYTCARSGGGLACEVEGEYQLAK